MLNRVSLALIGSLVIGLGDQVRAQLHNDFKGRSVTIHVVMERGEPLASGEELAKIVAQVVSVSAAERARAQAMTK